MILVDTDVASYVFDQRPRYLAYNSLMEGKTLGISVVTLGEIEYGMSLRVWGHHRRTLMGRYLSQFIVISPDEVTAKIWAQIRMSRRLAGRPISLSDAWIAATAVRGNLPLVTNNARDFQHIDGLKVLTATS